MSGLRVAIAHDYLTQRGGAERVVLAMARTFPGAPVHTALYDPQGTFPEFRDLRVHESWLRRVPGLRHRHRLGLPLYPLAFSTLRPDADVVVCSSSGWAHGIGGGHPTVVYCHTPARWLYDAGAFAPSGPARVGLALLGPPLRRWDRRAAHRATRYLANDAGVAERISRAYGIEAEVLHPPLGIQPEGQRAPVPGIGDGIVLSVARLLPYKHVDAVVAAAVHLPERQVVVVGDGPDRTRLRASAPANVTFLDAVTDEELRWLYSRAGVLAAPAEEDFGLTPVEAAAFGVPTVARRAGGHLTTVLDGRTGRLVDDLRPQALAAALAEALAAPWDPAVLRGHANDLSEAAFARRLREVVEEISGG